MPHSDFEQAVIDSLGALTKGQEGLSSQVSIIFKKIEGNGQPGLSQRLTVLENTCSMVQKAKAQREADEDARRAEDREERIARSGLHWTAWIAIAAAILSPIITALFEHFGK